MKNNIVNLSTAEIELLSDTYFLLRKHDITLKIKLLLEQSRENLQGIVKAYAHYWPPKADLSTGKLSRGENYRLLPYQVLDFPRFFNNEHICTFRILCWWGHEISCTLHIQGNCLPSDILTRLNKLKTTVPGIYFCIHSTPWEYHFGEDNYLPLQVLEDEQLQAHISSNNFIKVSRKLALQDAGQLPRFASDTFIQLMVLLSPVPSKASL